MFFIGEENSYPSYVEKISVEEPNRERENALKAVHMALKSRKIKTLRDFQKRRYCTAPTITGQHASLIRTAIPEIAGLFSQQDEQIEQDADLAPDANDHLDAQEDNLFEVGEVAVFRGTDGSNFNLLKITKTVNVDVNLRTRIFSSKTAFQMMVLLHLQKILHGGDQLWLLPICLMIKMRVS